jgi:hypothetical protein
MSMGITGTTTFTEIYQQRTNEGGSLKDVDGGKHLRFKDDSLYTHDSANGHSLGFIGRAKRHHEAVKTIKASIDQELGPGQGNALFKKLGLSNQKITVDQLQLLRTEVEELKRIEPFVPKGMELKPTKSGDYSGQVTLTWDKEHVTEMRGLIDDIQNAKLVPDKPLTEQFMRDVDRDTILLHKGTPDSEEVQKLDGILENLGLHESDSRRLTSRNAVGEMTSFTDGDRNVCENLSRFLQQDIWSSMITRVYRMENEEGNVLRPYVDLGNCQRAYDVYKDGDNFVIDFHWHSPIKGLTDSGTHVQLLSESGQTLDMSMRLTIPREALESGQLQQYQITDGPHATVNLTYKSTDQIF